MSVKSEVNQMGMIGATQEVYYNTGSATLELSANTSTASLVTGASTELANRKAREGENKHILRFGSGTMLLKNEETLSNFCSVQVNRCIHLFLIFFYSALSVLFLGLFNLYLIKTDVVTETFRRCIVISILKSRIISIQEIT